MTMKFLFIIRLKILIILSDRKKTIIFLMLSLQWEIFTLMQRTSMITSHLITGFTYLCIAWNFLEEWHRQPHRAKDLIEGKVQKHK